MKCTLCTAQEMPLAARMPLDTANRWKKAVLTRRSDTHIRSSCWPCGNRGAPCIDLWQISIADTVLWLGWPPEEFKEAQTHKALFRD